MTEWGTGSYFAGYRAPYVHFTAGEYATLATQHRMRVERIGTQLRAWDFTSREAFVEFANVTFVEWTRLLPPEHRGTFIDRYRLVGDGSAEDANVFHFYQMRVVLQRV